MKGLDTNVILRLLTGDDAKQATRARKYVENHCTAENPGFINCVVLAEIVWSLKSTYRYEQSDIIHAVELLLHSANFTVESSSLAEAALEESREGADFPDAFIALINKSAGCEKTASFDGRAARNLPDFELIP